MTLLLPDRDSQYNLKATNQKGLKTKYTRLKEDGAPETIQQSWKDHTVESDWKACEALQILELISVSNPQSF